MDNDARQAFIELILLAPYVDSHLSLTEDELLEKALRAVGWSSTQQGGVCLSTAFAAAREASTCEIKTDEFMQSRAAVLKDAGESSLIFGWLGRILGSDGMEGVETRFLLRAKALLFD